MQQVFRSSLKRGDHLNSRWIINIAMLFICGIQDFKEREISLWKIKLYGILALAVSLCDLFSLNDDRLLLMGKLLSGLIPGFFLLLLAKASKEAVGYGDGWILLFIGLSMGFWECLSVLLIGLLGIFLTAVFTAILLGRKKEMRIPFIPFLFIGMAGGYFWM